MRPKVAAVIVAAGSGSRFGGSPKQYRYLDGLPIVRAAIATFASHENIDHIQPVIRSGDSEIFARSLSGIETLPAVPGGATRQASVRAGLEALAALKPDIVLVHDAARPFATAELITNAIAAAQTFGAAVPGLQVVDTVKVVGEDDLVIDTPDRSRLRTVQTPQAFRFAPLLDAHRRAADEGRDGFTDDSALAEWAGLRVNIFEGERSNVKITTPDDLPDSRASKAALTDVRTATGFDVHCFEDGDHVWLGGVRIPHEKKLSGHSDADVVLHALTDALLGAITDGDIGSHFPPSDEQWRGASSDRFLAFAAERVRQRGGVITLLDATLLCEAPRVGPHRDAMRARIAEIAGITADRVAIKATTMEQLGFIGRREGIAAMATATVRLPESK
ncbi:bifunctional enzyme IspD/IspF [Variibacter gotjawalensis]|uniref:Bifunctional enzyme IspD/IspF n=1 Tax=Variibacter gotjawalensis TaxID=1333996 RepID=A0A0S3PWZ9_9BRAD|nr:2-C-methyl-D-erythritol 4-phosphate cytidylyltransferase/2-C-methyl-D-erythritol 2,4-cyclodiphosphate synthase [Variibacter gotjawalensis]RZS48192.1 2-C-methyl-D-erythritol 2,4-cyclodiphosphate synthase [Variibacter gotjawalensis]BAT60449.1 bifunctional enzyme IspD/IspF [Variibacter gotjawalensis]